MLKLRGKVVENNKKLDTGVVEADSGGFYGFLPQTLVKPLAVGDSVEFCAHDDEPVAFALEKLCGTCGEKNCPCESVDDFFDRAKGVLLQ